jgi:hypothetical protein
MDDLEIAEAPNKLEGWSSRVARCFLYPPFNLDDNNK